MYDLEVLRGLHTALSKGNEWATAGSMIIAVCSKKDLDCLLKGREYYLFDTGMVTGFIVLKATELGLVAHPIAGYDETRVKEVLGIPEGVRVITLIIVGKHSETMGSLLSDKQKEIEKERPERLPLEKFAYINRFAEGGK